MATSATSFGNGDTIGNILLEAMRGLVSHVARHQEALDRGASWRAGINAGIAMMAGNGKTALANAPGVEIGDLGTSL